MFALPKFLFHQSVNFWINLFWRLRITVIQDNRRRLGRHDILMVAMVDRKPGMIAHFLDYHRRLGVNHFLLVQTWRGSALVDAVKGQSDVTVFQPRFSRIGGQRGFRIKNALLQYHGHGHLCVLADCDEYLVYPRMETRTLRDLGDFLKNERRLGLVAVAIDRYAEAPLGDAAYGQEGDPFALCPHFDRDYYFERPVTDEIAEVRGGIFARLRGAASVRDMALLNRIPVVWWKWSHRLTARDFGMVPIKAMRMLDWKNPVISGAVMRFPFLSAGTDSEAHHRRILKERYGVGHERLLARRTEVFEPHTSRSMDTSADLVEAGLMSSGNWF